MKTRTSRIEQVEDSRGFAGSNGGLFHFDRNVNIGAVTFRRDGETVVNNVERVRVYQVHWPINTSPVYIRHACHVKTAVCTLACAPREAHMQAAERVVRL